MENHKTQQFSKFFIKDLKTKSPLFSSDTSDFNDINNSSAEGIIDLS